ncbi:DUF2178 domain-containing protein, partial [Candidatus Bathyarchaeota archaeon]
DAMKQKILTAAIIAVTGALVAIGFTLEITYLPVVTLLTGALAIRLLRRRAEEVLYDERAATINQKASAAAIAAFTLGVTAIGWLMMTWGATLDPAYKGIGYVLVYLGCGLLMLRMIFQYYYSWRLGGWDRGE